MNAETPMRTGGEILIDGLIGLGASTAFCVPGESYLGALDAIYDRQDRFRLITCRQEGGAAYMADAWGKLNNNPGICFVSRGPGASNAMVGIHTAFQDSTPLLCFVGQISRIDRGREAFQELDYAEVYGGVAKHVVTIDDARRIPEQLNQAWQQATCGRPGPVIVVLYEDMLKDEVVADDLLPRQHFPAAPDPRAVDQVVTMLNEATNPLVICGDSQWDCVCVEKLEAVAAKFQLPVASAFRRQDSFDNHNPRYIGELGLVAPASLDQYLGQCDLLLVIGPRLGDITSRGYQLLAVPTGNREMRLVHVHPAAEEINKVYQATVGITSSSAGFLSALLAAAPERAPDRPRLEALRQGYLEFVTTPRDENSALRMDRIMAWLRDQLSPTTIITNGAGNYTTWPQRHYQYRLAKTQLAPTNGSMGYGVPAAIAAKLSRPDAAVVSFSGDGCFLMNGQELATAVQYQLGIIFLVINNSRYGTIRSHQERHYPDRVVGTSLDNPDFAALAEAYGAKGYTVSRTDEFPAVFEDAMIVASGGRPVVIELVQDT